MLVQPACGKQVPVGMLKWRRHWGMGEDLAADGWGRKSCALVITSNDVFLDIWIFFTSFSSHINQNQQQDNGAFLVVLQNIRCFAKLRTLPAL